MTVFNNEKKSYESRWWRMGGIWHWPVALFECMHADKHTANADSVSGESIYTEIVD